MEASQQGYTDAPAAEAELRDQQHDQQHDYSDWPREGDDRPQPWDLRALGLEAEAAQLEPGAPNTVAPVVIEHDRPILTSGSADPSVHDLGRRLAELGHENSVSRGENPFGTVDDSILRAAQEFRARYGVEEQAAAFGPAGSTVAAQHIGPYTWEAVLRASERERENS